MSKTTLNKIISQLSREQQQSLVETVNQRNSRQAEPGKIPQQLNIAIIGLSGCYPEADHHYDFWQKLQQGTNLIREVPASRWDHNLYYDPGMESSFVPHKTRCKFGAFIKNHDQFDAAFFNIPAQEVPLMDPQERLALETTWSCIEDAGYVPGQLGKEVGIFSGVTYSEYQKLIPITTHPYMLNCRIAYFFNFQGPSITIDSGCSSSLAAIHTACQSLTRKECHTAIVIGTNLILHPDHYTSSSSVLSPAAQPHSNPFGIDDGWFPAEGVISILLKPLDQAIQDRDHIYAIIQSTHLCQEGKTSWFTAFNPKRQALLIRDNFQKSGINPETIGYIEAAANGSSMGDAIEMDALATAFKHFTDKKKFCPVGSVKANVGHGEAVSTLHQLTNVLLQFKSGTIIPLLNLKKINPNITIDGSPFYFATSPENWEPPTLTVKGKQFTLPRRAAISSFGAGGNMGHLILEEYTASSVEKPAPAAYFIPLSAPTDLQLRETVKNFIRFFKEYRTLDCQWQSLYTLSNLMFTLCVGRIPYRERVVFIVDINNPETLLEQWQHFLSGKTNAGIISKANAGTGDESKDNPQMVQRYIENKSWPQLARQWVRGTDIPPETWLTFFAAYQVQRIPLPTYCFQRQSFPIPEPAHKHQVANSSQDTPAATTKAAHVHLETRQDLPHQADNQLTRRFKEIFARAVNLPVRQIDLFTPLDKYGFDSMMVVGIANELETIFSSVPKTLFFECQTLRDVIDYFIKEYPEETREITDKPLSLESKEGPLPGKADIKTVYRESGRPQQTPGPSSKSKDIAIIGLAGRYPGAKNIHEFWKNLKQGKDSITEIPPERWKWQDYFHPDRQEAPGLGKTYSKWGGFIDDVDRFDPLFFNISPREAELMDPQERLFLETAWEALEDAGYGTISPNTQNNPNTAPVRQQPVNVGVFVGTTWEEYQLFSGSGQNGNEIISTNTSNISNRVSYFCNFKGSSLTVNTACSSSLTALHLACESLIRGRNTMALAGGVNISIHPRKHLFLANSHFVSGKGRCQSFGKGGDGFVPGEGVGCVLLKPLQQAIADQDHIYGIIKGTAINHGGKTNGYTVPNPNGQASVIADALNEAGISARTMGYIEAHGTGTSLGDPIEIAGLTKIFREYTSDTQFCAIGSAKSNIGHCESAAGIAGITKVLLQLKHGQLVPSLHSRELNPDIDFSKTPFLVQQELTEWKPPRVTVNGETRQYPRRAGISSFGAGGANAHIVMEEYVSADREKSQPPLTSAEPAIILLSARNKERLKEQVRCLLTAITDQDPDSHFSPVDLADIAFTLQVGREAMEERLALMVKSLKELTEKLEGWLQGRDNIEELYRGQVKRSNETIAFFSADEELQEAVDKWVQRKKYSNLLDLWVNGLFFDWNRLYINRAPAKPGRISLPTYPFARERYWADSTDPLPVHINGAVSPVPANHLHPLVHRNTSDLREQRFTSVFSGQEFFLADHVIKGQRMLPGVAYLEMARAAVHQAAGNGELHQEQGDQNRIRLKNVVWAQPTVVEQQPVQVHIGLFPENGNNRQIAFEIYSRSSETGAEPMVHSQGTAILEPTPETPCLDLQALQEECSQDTISAGQYYETFRTMGIDYGPGHQGIEKVSAAPGGNKVLARLSLPSAVSDTQHQFVLHPGLMDSALQASLGLMIAAKEPQSPGKAVDSKTPIKPVLPFALQELEILGECQPSMWALVQYAGGSKPGDRVQKLDIRLCDLQGKICVQMKGFSTRVLEGEPGPLRSQAAIGTLMLQPGWTEQAIHRERITAAPAHKYARHLVILDKTDEEAKEIIKILKTRITDVDFLTRPSREKNIGEQFHAYSLRVFTEIQSILKTRPKGKVLVQALVSTQGEGQLFSGMAGLLKTAHIENPALISQLIEMEPGIDPEEIPGILKENSQYPEDNRIRYQDGKRQVAGWETVEISKKTGSMPWKDRGVYLITGGAGGLGWIFAREIAQQVKQSTLVLTGRSLLNRDKKEQLEELQTSASVAAVRYRQADVTRKQAVVDLIRGICSEFGGLNGIIHCAGVNRDNFILKKTKEEWHDVLAPKVKGLVHLDRATSDMNLDFFILFSSVTGAMGNAGQADYAAANAFMDAYARYRNDLAATKLRRGLTLSINWPLWKEGGMRADAETENMWRQSLGMTAMQTKTGIRALYQIFSSVSSPHQHQVMVIEGEIDRLGQRLLSQSGQAQTDPISKKAPTAVPVAAAEMESDKLREKASDYFKSLLSPVIKLPAQRIDADAPMEKYGIDSIMVMQLTNQLEKTFGSLSKTLFFEYQDIRELTGYFLESHRDRLVELLGTAEQAPGVPAAVRPVKPVVSPGSRPRFLSFPTTPREESAAKALDIAVVGLAGRYPGARNTLEFWKNLRDGKDCITEIPADRWDHSLYFDDNKDSPGKTYSKWGGFLAGVYEFDPLFFNISPREAIMIDPQERLFLECVFAALEDAGYTRENTGMRQNFGLAGNVGVYVGVMYEEYQLYGAQETVRGRPMALPGNPSSIANRVSYFCNFHGPSLAVDTMCSSSLTAIHLACQSLQRGEIEAAVAGGVNISIHPNKYLLLAQGQFASSKGRCESFGRGGDGYVPGEGVGAVLLKPLSTAIAHRDHIYGIIKATAINHGGKTNGYSVPNPNAQASVIGRAFKQAGISPRHTGYIEAHGTGTSLGDPIEITGLTKTFREFTRDRQFCIIGSTKSNIGHCESAAGIAGVTKVLLQMKYKQLVPSLHSRVLNPNIDFSHSPFVVQQELAEWKPPRMEIDGETKTYPRIAGISSFGAGGSNAHVLMEEYIPGNREPAPVTIPVTIDNQNPAIILLSARNQEQLQERVQQLLAAVTASEHSLSDDNLSDIAYTLQVGREAMEERLAITADSMEDLEQKLKGFAEGQEDIPHLYRGRVKRNKENAAVLAADEDMEKTITAWINKRKYEKLLDLWVQGLTFDWNRLYDGSSSPQPRRISLPTYPFARKPYRIPVSQDSPGAGAYEKSPALHPLLDRVDARQSLEQGVVFLKTLKRSDLIISDHQVNGQLMFPGVGCLEMARAAAVHVVGSQTCQLSRVIWQHPLVLEEQEKDVQIVIEKENRLLKYRIHTNNGKGPITHARGEIHVHPAAPGKEEQIISIAEIRSRCTRRIDRETLYSRFQEAGLTYGPYFKGLQEILVNKNGQEALGALSLPAAYQHQLNHFALHPTLTDSALQVIAGLSAFHQGKNRRFMVPFAAAKVEVLHPLQSEGYAYVVTAGENLCHVAILDSRGRVCIKFHHLAIKELKIKDLRESTDQWEHFFYVPQWKFSPLSDTQTRTSTAPGNETPARQTILLIYSPQGLKIKQALADVFSGEKVIEVQLSPESPGSLEQEPWWEEGTGIDAIYFLGGIQTGELDEADLPALELSQQNGVLALFRLIKILNRHKYAQRNLHIKAITNNVHRVFPGDTINPYGASLHGLCKSMAKEYPKWQISCIDIHWPAELSTEEAGHRAAALAAEPGSKMGQEVALRQGRRYIRVIHPILLPPAPGTPIRQQGVYLILGGAGGIGLQLGLYLAETASARLILVGRNPLDTMRQEKISGIENKGGEVLYLQADAADVQSMQTVIEKAKARFGHINGVFHSAIVLRDKTLAGMDEETFRAALAPKVTGSVILNKVMDNEPLDFMMFFSSAQSFSGNAGQGNYAAASTFKDAFALYLDQTRPYPVKVINWGYWGSVGIVADQEIQQRFASRGLFSIEPKEGMEAVKRMLGHRLNQIIPIKAKDFLLESMAAELDCTLEILPRHKPSQVSHIQEAPGEILPSTTGSHELSRHRDIFARVERSGQLLLLEVFQQMGVFRQGGEHYVDTRLRDRLEIIPAYFKLFEALLDILARAGFIEIIGREITTTSGVEEEGLQKELAGLAAAREELMAGFPEIKAHVDFLWTCVQRYPEILTGKIPATEIIFPGSSLELVEGVYKNNVVSDSFNRLVARSVLSYIKASVPGPGKDKKISILEVGAGTGGTTAAVLEAIKDYAEKLHYVYTDISGAFTLFGKKNFGSRFPFVEFKTLDIEKDPGAQGFSKGTFDIIIAANVLHATRSLRDTVRNVKTLLETNGWLILYEATEVSNFATLTFGLLEGWWLFRDEAERLKGAPLLSRDMWVRLLKEEGFEQVMTLSPYENGDNNVPQQVFLAESNGILKRNKKNPFKKEKAADIDDVNVKTPALKVDGKANTPDRPVLVLPANRQEQKGEELGRTIEDQVIETVSTILQIDRQEIDPDTPYSDFGVDSISAVSIINKINEALAIELQATDLFNYSTIRSLSQHIVKQFGHQFQAYAGKGKDSDEDENGDEDKTGIETAELFNEAVEPLFSREESDIDKRFFEDPGLQEGKAEGNSNQRTGDDAGHRDIAVIGMAGQFPGARDVDEFWINLQSGKDSIGKIPLDRWEVDELVDSGFGDIDKRYFQRGGFLSEIHGFDSLFFNISTREAELMDPQQRLFLQQAWTALEDAGYSAGDLSEQKCGVFVGCGTGDYKTNFNEQEAADAYAFSGNVSSILTARIAYLLNLKGPSLAVDTACSSSLVAVHLACESIGSGTCEMAIAGGVTLMTTPILYVNFSKAGMLSPYGRCKTFDNDADGFVPGEGVGAVILKPLDQALEEGDHIYGIIKGSDINQDGKTNGITAPSAPSQAALECEVYDKYSIHPETISYIEAHGTGTKLGDPIEIQALSTAFGKYTQKRHFCAIGSVKTNIGHTLAAAGAAALIKVLLSLKHRQLPPSLNFKQANEHINFRESPFYVNTQLKQWPAGGNPPRRAAVSSFGFSGTNCHLIVEEAPDGVSNTGNSAYPYYLVPFSAKTASALRKRTEILAQWLDNERNTYSIHDITYTLLTGRTHFSHRSALLVKDRHDLEQKLKTILNGDDTADCLTNKIDSKSPDPGPVFRELGSSIIEELTHSNNMEAVAYKEKLSALADLYTRGYDLEWRGLYEGRKNKRISLPTYPFDLERCWFQGNESEKIIIKRRKPGNQGVVPRLHPLIGRNISTWYEEKFATNFTGQEFYLSHHIINHQKVLPGVAFIEMVRAAGELAGEKPVHRLKNITWLRPIILAENQEEIYINLFPNPDSDLIDFEVSSGGADNQRVVHARGQLTYGTTGEQEQDRRNESLNIEEIKQRCPRKMAGSTCYDLYGKMGLQLGPSFQVIQELYSNETEVLSLLRLPEGLKEGFDEFTLHPAMTDGALQSGIGLADAGQGDSLLWIPFSLGELEIKARLTQTCYALFTVVGKRQSEGQENRRFAVRIMDETGNVLVKIEDFQARPLWPAIRGAELKSGSKETGVTYFNSYREKKPVHPTREKLPGQIVIFDHDDRLFEAIKNRPEIEQNNEKADNAGLILVKPGEMFQELGDFAYQINPGQVEDYRQFFKGPGLQGHLPVQIIHNWSGGENISDQLDNGIYSLFYLSQVLMTEFSGNKNSIDILYLHPGDENGPLPQYAGVSGFARTIPWENPRIRIKTLEIEHSLDARDMTAPQTAGIILEELMAGADEGMGIEFSYRNGLRWQKSWREFALKSETGQPGLLKEKGIYLVTGGMGSLGMIFARYLAAEIKAKLVLTDRFQLGPEGKTRLRELESLGAEAVYIQADVSRYEEVKNLVKKTKSRYPSINGIIHTAGIVRDALIKDKTRKDMEEVMAPKVYGTIYLDKAFREENLDFFVLFSSIAAVTGNTGQCDYAYANRFMDYFAERREHLREKQLRRGRTFSINWPLWQEGGLTVNQSTGEFLRHTLGVRFLETAAGLKAFSGILASGNPQVMIWAGEAQKIRQMIEKTPGAYNQKPAGTHLAERAAREHVDQDRLSRNIHRDIVKIAAAISKVRENRLEPGKNLAEYGFDSITLVEFTNTINKKFNLGITPALFFEYPSLGAFSNYLYNEHREHLAGYYREQGKSPAAAGLNRGHEGHEIHGDISADKKVSTRFRDLAGPGRAAGREQQSGMEPAAIIGISGIMPQSENLEIFWKHLEGGNDLITKIPPERWEWGGFNEAIASDRDIDMGEEIWGGYMKEVDKFDTLFFGISPREAELMDPQQRIFLETTWKAIEDAGYRVSDLSGTKTGLFVGVSTGDYSDIIRANEKKIEAQLATGMSHCILANRVSYLFNFHGPSQPIDTACSSSLIALHQAVESIRSGDCEMAIAGGVNVILSPAATISFTKAGMLSPDGRCKTFDKSANGYVRGEGAGAVFIKPLSRAIRDGDHIYAVIKGTAVNHGGHASSLTAPNPAAQADLLVEAYEKAGIPPSTVSFIETHGTGTSLGDPVEINGLKRAFTELYKRRGQAPQTGYCGIGAVKTNIGHLEAAAGMAGLLKVLLAMKHRKLPTNVHFKELNPYIQLENSPFYIIDKTRYWETLHDKDNQPVPRRAGISSFGFGGANAHIVLEEYEAPVHRQNPPSLYSRHLVVLSARNEERLKDYAREMVRFLDNALVSAQVPVGSSEVSLENICSDILQFIAGIIDVNEDAIDGDENLTDYGFDPVGFSKLAEQISHKYELEVKSDIFTDHPSVNHLAEWVKKSVKQELIRPQPHRSTDINLLDIAYTLQVGREALDERLAVIVSDIPQLKEKLTLYCRGNRAEDIENLFQGNKEESKSISGFLLEGNEGSQYLDTIIQAKKPEKLAKLWVSGIDLDWKLLYQGQTPNRMALPTYPFASERYWVSMQKTAKKTSPAAPTASPPPREPRSRNTETPAPAAVEKEEKPFIDVLMAQEPQQRKEMLESFLCEQIRAMLRLSPTQKLDPEKPLVNVGLDSLMALELRKQIQVKLQLDVSMIKFLGGESVADLARLLLDHISEPNKRTGSSISFSSTPLAGEPGNDDGLQNDIMEGVI